MHKRCGAFTPLWNFHNFVQNFTEGDMTNHHQSQFVLEEGIIKQTEERGQKKTGKGKMGKRMSLWPLWICHTPKAALPGWDWQTNYPQGRFVDSGEMQDSKAHLTCSVGPPCFLLSILERAEEQEEQALSQHPSELSVSSLPMSYLVFPDSNPRLHGQIRDQLTMADASLFALYKEDFGAAQNSQVATGNFI